MVIGALFVLVIANRRGRFKLGALAAGAIMVLAIALVTTATQVTTAHERIVRATARLINAATTGDRAGTESVLATDARLNLAGAGAFSLSRDGLLRGVDALAGEDKVSDHRILKQTASEDGPNAGRSRVVVRVGIASAGPTFSSWELSWRREKDESWRVTRLECLSINGKQPGALFAGELSRFAR